MHDQISKKDKKKSVLLTNKFDSDIVKLNLQIVIFTTPKISQLFYRKLYMVDDQR
jgi:hypothetical protein